jgi:hypothetical protein
MIDTNAGKPKIRKFSWSGLLFAASSLRGITVGPLLSLVCLLSRLNYFYWTVPALFQSIMLVSFHGF